MEAFSQHSTQARKNCKLTNDHDSCISEQFTRFSSDKKIQKNIFKNMEEFGERRVLDLLKSYNQKIQAKPDRYFSETISENSNRISKTEPPIKLKSNFNLYFRPVLNDDFWCFECFTTNPDDENSEICLQETICSHIFCEDCIAEMIKEAVSIKKNLKCPHCSRELLKLF